MKAAALIAFLAEPENEPDELLAADTRSRRALARQLIAAVDQRNKRTKNRAAKLLAKLAFSDPKLLRREREHLIGLLDSRDTIVLWNAIIVIGHLAAVDDDGRIKALALRLRRFFEADSMITTGHAIEALGRIAEVSEKQRNKIANWLIGAGDTHHGEECREILAGKALGALDGFVGLLRNKARVRAFAELYVASPRSGVAKRARRLLKKLG